jgi:hypothetical protein
MEKITAAIAIIMVWGVMGLFMIGVIWAPFAALICGISAKSKGMSAIRYAVAGAAYSLLFLIPSLYFTLRLLRLRVPRVVVDMGYIFILILWTLFIAVSYGGLAHSTLNSTFLSPPKTHYFQSSHVVSINVTVISAAVLAYCAWGITLWKVTRMRRRAGGGTAWDEVIPDNGCGRLSIIGVLLMLGFLVIFVVEWAFFLSGCVVGC